MRVAISLFLLAAILYISPRAYAQEGKLVVELNKLEEIDNGCRSFFLFRNGAETTLSGFEMSLAILDTDGVIDRLLTIDAAPLPANRTTLKLFEISDISCARIGEILLHEITTCEASGGEAPDCFGMLGLRSRADAQLVM